jgi:phage tail sheath protein FI
MQSAIVSNDDIRSEVNAFNIIAAPGFPEMLDEMVSLSTDRRNTAFVVADSPFRLKADATSTKNWATNANNASENGEDGLVSSSPYAAVYYPSALTTNLDGTNVVVPSSHVALRTLAFNDQVAFPWFAPAGFQRGLVQNATSVGFVDPTTGEYTAVTLNEGQRDTLYGNKINPIAQFPGRGLAVFGQKTLNPTASALDRINVARLIVYIRERLDDIVKPFLFEPNDAVTRQNAKNVVDGLMSNLVIQRGLFDFVTVCDSTNNTSARIDRNELYIDIAIQPVKAVEFIYIPIRIQNTLGSTGSS